MYYQDKLDSLKDIFGASKVSLTEQILFIDGKPYPIVNDVIIILEESKLPPSMKQSCDKAAKVKSELFSPDIQYTFGEEWKTFSGITPEHEETFKQYFDLLDLTNLNSCRMCDLGCGIGRWSYFLADRCREIILLDFSEAIFVARGNLKNNNNAIFLMGDINDLPFRNDFADIIFSLGVLHHLPNNALEAIKAIRRYAPMIYVYLYYALDNRPVYFRWLLGLVTILRRALSKISNTKIRDIYTWAIALTVYKPLIGLGTLMSPLGLSKMIPLYEGYQGKSLRAIRQDVYDRFFTGIEQRFSRNEIMQLKDSFSQVTISPNLPYWHFICER